MSAKDIAGVAGVIFVLTSAVSIFAELFNSGGAALQVTRFTAYGLCAALVVAAVVRHNRWRRGADGPAAPLGTPPQPFPGQRAPKNRVGSR